MPQVTGKTHSHTIEPTAKLPVIDFSDPNFFQSTSVDILLGGDIYPVILRTRVLNGICDMLVAQETIFGWIVAGPVRV